MGKDLERLALETDADPAFGEETVAWVHFIEAEGEDGGRSGGLRHLDRPSEARNWEYSLAGF